MVFSSILGLSTDRRNRQTATNNKEAVSTTAKAVTSSGVSRCNDHQQHPEYIFDEAHLPRLDPEAPDLRELNSCLEALAAVFPDVQIDVFREMLSSFDGESRLAVVADALLKNKTSWVKGRWRVSGEAQPSDTKRVVTRTQQAARSLVRSNEVFRSPEYKEAVKLTAWHEFKGLSRPTINAVLAEFNYSYLDARPTLVELSAKSWSFAISSVFLRRKPVSSSEAADHPLVVWKSSGRGSIVPCLRSTGNAELDRELFDHLIVPLRERARASQVEEDRTLAMSLNTTEAEEANATYDCACCFASGPFEEFTSCGAEGHLICVRCVQHSIKEAVFGQGWIRNINVRTGGLICPAVDSTECKGCIPAEDIRRAMLEDKKGAEILIKFDERLADHCLVASGLPLVRCPFCSYAEVDDTSLPPRLSDMRLRDPDPYNLILLFLCIGAIFFLLPLLIVGNLGRYIVLQVDKALLRHRRRQRGLRFTCRSPTCKRTSCLSCGKEWIDVHVCHESELVALRTQVEQAMSMAVKRVCPRCNTSFVKTAGCNKLTCPCGYKMCYVCRKDIGGTGGEAGYQHFCNHFRPTADRGRPCDQCDKCNLWEAENTEAVLEKARREAEDRWLETRRREKHGDGKGKGSGNGNGNGKGLRDVSPLPSPALRRRVIEGVSAPASPGVFSGRWPTVEEVLDLLVENLFE